jgi:hypothetical protein
MDGTVVENQVMERRPECILMSTKVQKLMWKSAGAKGRTAESFTVDLTAAEKQPPSEFYIGDELSDQQRDELR